jgi:hypothetical protein
VDAATNVTGTLPQTTVGFCEIVGVVGRMFTCTLTEAVVAHPALDPEDVSVAVSVYVVLVVGLTT